MSYLLAANGRACNENVTVSVVTKIFILNNRQDTGFHLVTEVLASDGWKTIEGTTLLLSFFQLISTDTLILFFYIFSHPSSLFFYSQMADSRSFWDWVSLSTSIYTFFYFFFSSQPSSLQFIVNTLPIYLITPTHCPQLESNSIISTNSVPCSANWTI